MSKKKTERNVFYRYRSPAVRKWLSVSDNAVEVERPASLYSQDKKDWPNGEILLHGSWECDETAQKENGTCIHPGRIQVLVNAQEPSLEFLVLQLGMSESPWKYLKKELKLVLKL